MTFNLLSQNTLKTINEALHLVIGEGIMVNIHLKVDLLPNNTAV